jgi:hypothetical protein
MRHLLIDTLGRALFAPAVATALDVPSDGSPHGQVAIDAGVAPE